MRAGIPLREDYDAAQLRALAEPGQCAEPSPSGAWGDLRWSLPFGCGPLSGVGLQIIRDWVLRFNAEGPEGLKNRKPPLQTERGAARRAGGDCRERPRSRDPWCGALAAPGGLAQGAVRHLPGGDDSWAGAAPDGLCEAVRPSTPLCPGRWQRLKNFSERLKEIRAALGDDVEIEVWWQDEARVGQKNKIPGPNAAPDRQHPRTRGRRRLISSSAPARAKLPALSCPMPTRKH